MQKNLIALDTSTSILVWTVVYYTTNTSYHLREYGLIEY